METEQIDRFEVLGELGSGGFARVYKVVHPVTEDVLALKWLLAAEEMGLEERGYYEEVRERFVEDAKTLVRLSSLPGVVQVFDIAAHEDRPFYTMELMEGSLAELFGGGEEGKPAAELDDWQELVGYILQVLATLEEVHTEGVIHRDLKPGNVLLRDLKAKIADFGLARRESGSRVVQSRSHMGLASGHYVAPEQEINASGVDVRADLFSVGVILYRGLSGRYPRHARFRPLSHFRSDLPPGLVELVDVLLEEVESRPSSAAEALGMLEQVFRQEDVEVGVEQSEAPGGASAPSVRSSPRTGDVLKETIYSGVELEFVYISPGEFCMGSPDSEEGREDDEGPVHTVEISRGFYLGKYAVTQSQWEGVMGTRPWFGKNHVQESSSHPAV